MDLSSVSYAELEAELKRRNSISKSSSDNDDVMTPILETTKVNKEVVQEELEKDKDREIEELKQQLKQKEIEASAMRVIVQAEKNVAEMASEHERHTKFVLEHLMSGNSPKCQQTTEQLSLFPWNRH